MNIIVKYLGKTGEILKKIIFKRQYFKLRTSKTDI